MKKLFSFVLIFGLLFQVGCSSVSLEGRDAEEEVVEEEIVEEEEEEIVVEEEEEEIPEEVVEEVEEVLEEVLEGEVEVRVNTDPDSNVAMIAEAPNGEKMILVTMDEGYMVLIETVDGERGSLMIGENGYPVDFTFKDHYLTFENYTDTTVDVAVELPDGTVELYEAMPFTPPKELSFMRWLMPVAYAGDSDVLEYFNIGSLALNVVSCGVATTVTIASGTLLAPLAYLGCGGLVLRGGHYVWQSLPCSGTKEQVIQCAHEQAEKEMKKGPTFKGQVTDMDNGDRLANVAIQIRRTDGTIITSGITNEFGLYELEGIYEDKYTMTAALPEYIERSFSLNILSGQLIMRDVETNEKIYDDKSMSWNRAAQKYIGPLDFDFTLKPASIYDGRWEGRANETSGTIDCAGADFYFDVEGGVLTGVADADMGYELKLKGTVEGDGKIEAGSATGDYDTALFHGNLFPKNDSGNGTWGSAQGCEGDWMVLRTEETY